VPSGAGIPSNSLALRTVVTFNRDAESLLGGAERKVLTAVFTMQSFLRW
jgi:hypothetical protein